MCVYVCACMCACVCVCECVHVRVCTRSIRIYLGPSFFFFSLPFISILSFDYLFLQEHVYASPILLRNKIFPYILQLSLPTTLSLLSMRVNLPEIEDSTQRHHFKVPIPFLTSFKLACASITPGNCQLLPAFQIQGSFPSLCVA